MCFHGEIRKITASTSTCVFMEKSEKYQNFLIEKKKSLIKGSHTADNFFKTVWQWVPMSICQTRAVRELQLYQSRNTYSVEIFLFHPYQVTTL